MSVGRSVSEAVRFTEERFSIGRTVGKLRAIRSVEAVAG